MKLKTKLFLVLFICFISGYFIYSIYDFTYVYVDTPLSNKSSYNFFDDITTYLEETSNAICTQEIISTGMYTDGNSTNYKVIIQLPSEDPYMQEAWSQGHASIVFESFLQRTTEWIDNNEYKITMYYLDESLESTKPIIFFQKQWVGCDYRVSAIQPLPKKSKGKSIFIKYESVLGSFFFFPNGNDLRFLDNYLSVQPF